MARPPAPDCICIVLPPGSEAFRYCGSVGIDGASCACLSGEVALYA